MPETDYTTSPHDEANPLKARSVPRAKVDGATSFYAGVKIELPQNEDEAVPRIYVRGDTIHRSILEAHRQDDDTIAELVKWGSLLLDVPVDDDETATADAATVE